MGDGSRFPTLWGAAWQLGSPARLDLMMQDEDKKAAGFVGDVIHNFTCAQLNSASGGGRQQHQKQSSWLAVWLSY